MKWQEEERWKKIDEKVNKVISEADEYYSLICPESDDEDIQEVSEPILENDNNGISIVASEFDKQILSQIDFFYLFFEAADPSIHGIDKILESICVNHHKMNTLEIFRSISRRANDFDIHITVNEIAQYFIRWVYSIRELLIREKQVKDIIERYGFKTSLIAHIRLKEIVISILEKCNMDVGKSLMICILTKGKENIYYKKQTEDISPIYINRDNQEETGDNTSIEDTTLPKWLREERR